MKLSVVNLNHKITHTLPNVYQETVSKSLSFPSYLYKLPRGPTLT